MRLEKLVALSVSTLIAATITTSPIVPQAVQSTTTILDVRARFARIVIGY